MAALTNDALKDPVKAKDQLVGPSYSYVDQIQDPGSKGVGEDGSFGQIWKNVRAMGDWVNDIGWTNRPLGDSYFTNTGGKCITPSGKLEDRYTYINNQPPEGGLTRAILGRGLAAGVVGDAAQMNPVNLYTAIKANATPPCKLYKCQVTNETNGTQHYMTPSLTPDFSKSKCQEIPEPKDPDADIKASIESLQGKIKELKTLVAAEPDDKDLKKRLQEKQDELTTLLEDQTNMAERRKEYAAMPKEPFAVMSSPALGGLLLAVILLGTFAFRK